MLSALGYGRPSSLTQEADRTMEKSGQSWAAASARTLARRLRRQTLAAIKKGEYIDVGARMRHLKAALLSHARLDKLVGRHEHRHGAALSAARPMLLQEDFQAERNIKRLGDLARHSAFQPDHEADAAAGGLTQRMAEDCEVFGSCCSGSEVPASDCEFGSSCSNFESHGYLGADYTFELDRDDLDSYEAIFFGESELGWPDHIMHPDGETVNSFDADKHTADADRDRWRPGWSHSDDEIDIALSEFVGVQAFDIPAHWWPPLDTTCWRCRSPTAGQAWCAACTSWWIDWHRSPLHQQNAAEIDLASLNLEQLDLVLHLLGAVVD